MDNEHQNSNPMTVAVKKHGIQFSVTFKYGRLYVYPTPTDVLQLIEIKTAAKRMFQERLTELELYENNNDYVAICAANFLSNARRVMCFGQGQDGYQLMIIYDFANYPRLELYHNERIDALRDQYVLKESLTIGYIDDTNGWLIKHIKYDGDKETCVILDECDYDPTMPNQTLLEGTKQFRLNTSYVTSILIPVGRSISQLTQEFYELITNGMFNTLSKSKST